MLDSLRNLLFHQKSASANDANTSMTHINNRGTSSNNNDDHTGATSGNNDGGSREDPVAGLPGVWHGQPSGVRVEAPASGTVPSAKSPHPKTTTTPSAKHDIHVGVTCGDGKKDKDG